MHAHKNRHSELKGLRAGALALALTILGSNAVVAAAKEWWHYGGNR